MLTYLFIVFGVIIATILFMYIDGRLFDRPKKKMTYFKVILMNIAIVLVVVYILTWLSPTGDIKKIVQMGGDSGVKITGPDTIVPGIGETMLSGPPPF